MTKKDMIRELTIAGALPKEIANQLNTTPEYVYKERGKLRREGKLVTHQSLSITDGTQSVAVAKSPADSFHYAGGSENDFKINRGRISSNYYDIPPLNRNELMCMYESFYNLQGPVDVIKNHGIHPELCQREFARFMDFHNFDPFNLQEEIVSRIKDPSPEIKTLISISRGYLLSNKDILDLVDFLIQK